MAKYSADYSCGHGSRIINLVGAHKERDSKLAWYASSGPVCKDCLAAKDPGVPVATSSSNHETQSIVISVANAYPHRESLKKAGFSWAASEKSWVWSCQASLLSTAVGLADTFFPILSLLKDIGCEKITGRFPMSL